MAIEIFAPFSKLPNVAGVKDNFLKATFKSLNICDM